MKFSTTLALLVTTFTTLVRAQEDPDYPVCTSKYNILNVRGPLPGGAYVYPPAENGGDFWYDPQTKDVAVQWAPNPDRGIKWKYAFFNYRSTLIAVGVEWKVSPNVVRHSIFALEPGADCHKFIGDPITRVGFYNYG
jgi:hypothetical protein